MGNELRQRLSWSIAILLIAGLLFLFAASAWARPLIGLGVAAIVVVGLWEYFNLARAKGHTPPYKLLIAVGFAYVAVGYFVSQGVISPFAQVAMVALAFFVAFVARFRASEGDRIADVAIGFFGFVYVALTFSMLLNMLYLNGSEHVDVGQWWVVFVILVTVSTDIGAYFLGKRFGRHKLAPTLSPGKTWEGAAGGLAAALVVGFLLGIFGRPMHPIWTSLVLSLILGVVGQFGDLAESVLKRDAGVKDSNKLPGLGGVLDVIDGLLFTLPAGFLAQHYMLTEVYGRIL